MTNPRTYGNPPYRIAVIHGGPGAAGEMASVARQLASDYGILEPLQTATSLDGQVDELADALERCAELPAVLIGFSWGAWLGFIVAARLPRLVRKLILVGSGPFEQQYVASLQETRMSRLTETERAEFESTVRGLGGSAARDRDRLLSRLGALASKTDTYDALDVPGEPNPLGGQGDLFRNVWNEAAELRKSGRLMDLAAEVRCPVAAIHGDYDPHPACGVETPLSSALDDFRLTLLDNCGHKPWIERQARNRFYDVLRKELS